MADGEYDMTEEEEKEFDEMIKNTTIL